MVLVISLFLALIPLLGIVYIIFFGSLTTVDGLFMSLILLSISGILGLNVLIELRKGKSAFAPSRSAPSARTAGPVAEGSQLTARGKVKEVCSSNPTWDSPTSPSSPFSTGAALR